MLRALTVFLLLAGLPACDAAPPPIGVTTTRDSAGIEIVETSEPLWLDDEAWEISARPRLVIAADGEDALHFPTDPTNAYLNRSGELVVGDGMINGWNSIMVFSQVGEHVRTISRQGEGPCEFEQLWWVAPYRGDSIAAYDYAEHKLAILSATGQCARDLRLPDHSPPRARGTWAYSAGAEGVFADGSILAAPNGYLDVSDGPGLVWYRHALMRVGADGVVSDSLGLFEIAQESWTGTRSTVAPFMKVARVAVRDSTFLFGAGERFEVREYDMTGDLRRIFRRAYDPKPVSPADRSEFIEWYMALQSNSRHESEPGSQERMRRSLENEASWPTHKPAHNAIVVDDAGRTWVEHYRRGHPLEIPAESDSVAWSIFDERGHWLGEIKLPAVFTITAVQGDDVIGLWKAQQGTSEVRVYSLVRPSG